MNITLFGGTGFVGRNLCEHLVGQGHAVRVIGRGPQAAGLAPAVEYVQGNPYDTAQLGRWLQGQDAVINLIGILHGSEAEFRRTHVELAENIARACLAAGVPRLLHMSALHASPMGPSLYLRSKGEGEDRVHALGGEQLHITSFRPSVIFGPQDNFLNRFAQLLRWAPGIMLLPGAHTRFAPVYVGDVVAAFAHALSEPQLAGARIDLCGPKDYSLLELVRLTAQWSGHPRLILPMPEAMARAMAYIMEWLPNPPLTRDNLNSMRIDSVCSRDCPRQPTSLEQIALTGR